MKMPSKFADALMDDLFCLAVFAYAGVSVDGHGDISVDDEVKQIGEEYAKQKFIELCHSWEEVMGEKWEIGEEA